MFGITPEPAIVRPALLKERDDRPRPVSDLNQTAEATCRKTSSLFGSRLVEWFLSWRLAESAH